MRSGEDTSQQKEHDDGDTERWKERGVMLRVFVYVFATHLFAGFVWLLSYVGQHAPKQSRPALPQGGMT
ncbi:DUF6126 family protein [Streptomyces sp. NRRL B-24572]|uniref:DUF6126 family protein n=1 Tax=Streptomyces sp. NRRL B-24572 TaxID=1962156 RepID=UPI000A3670A4|nr:DUF6126 family protein [Streptomyces sp. NRRL B-24572]